MKSPVLQFHEVNVHLAGNIILNKLSFSLHSGLHFITGLNGSGKTTLLNTLLGHLPYQGSIRLMGKELREYRSPDRAQKVAIVYQYLHIPFQLKVYDFVLMGRFPYLSWMGTYAASDHEKVDHYLQLLGISRFVKRNLDEISGGELQKVMIARALCQETPMILLDEPAQSLDPKNKQEVYQLIQKLAGEENRCLICTTHDVDALSAPESRTLGLNHGKLVLDQKGGVPVHQLYQKVYGIDYQGINPQSPQIP